jgi:hypothetical protein
MEGPVGGHKENQGQYELPKILEVIQAGNNDFSKDQTPPPACHSYWSHLT